MTITSDATDREAWLQWRRGGIGGSDIAGLLLPGKWSSPWKVWAEKVGLLEPTETTQRQRIGQRMEAVLAAEFEDARPGLKVQGEQTWCEHPGHRWVRCTVDGYVIDGHEPIATVQFKTDARYGWPEGPPAAYRAQCIWEMGVTGLRHCFLAVMFGGFRFEVFEIPWDADAQADWDLMFKTAESFWLDHVLPADPPPVDGSDATADTLSAVYPDHIPGVTIELDGLADILSERGDLKDDAKRIKERLACIDAEVKARFGDAEVGTIGGVPVFTYRSSERAGYEVKPTTVRTLRAAKGK